MSTEHNDDSILPDGAAQGIADATAGLPNRLGVKNDPARYQQSDAWRKAYDRGYHWKKHGPGRFTETTSNAS